MFYTILYACIHICIDFKQIYLLKAEIPQLRTLYGHVFKLICMKIVAVIVPWYIFHFRTNYNPSNRTSEIFKLRHSKKCKNFEYLIKISFLDLSYFYGLKKLVHLCLILALGYSEISKMP